MSERWKNSLNAGDGLSSTANTTAVTEGRAAHARRLIAALALAAQGEVRGNTLRAGEGSQPTDTTADGRGDPVIRAFGTHVLGLSRIVQPSGERTTPLPTPDQQPPADS